MIFVDHSRAISFENVVETPKGFRNRKPLSLVSRPVFLISFKYNSKKLDIRRYLSMDSFLQLRSFALGNLSIPMRISSVREEAKCELLVSLGRFNTMN